MAGIQLIAEIEPKNSGSFALLDDKYMRGGLRVVETYDELASIPSDRLKDGCLSMVTTPSRVLYVYDQETDTWSPFSSGGGGGGSDWLCVEDGETTKLVKDVDTWTQKVVVINHIRTYADYFALPTEYIQNNEVAYCKADVMEGTTTYKKGLYSYDIEKASWVEVNSTIEIDSALSDTSKRPVQNRVVTRALEEKVSKDDVDNVISRFSENPIQNKAVATALENIKPGKTMTAEEYESLDDETKNDDSFYYISDTGEIYQNGIIYGGKQIFDVTQEEYDALTDEEKANNEYHCTDTGRVYINGILYGDKKSIEMTYEEYKQLEADGLVESDVDYIIITNENGILLGATDVAYDSTKTVKGKFDELDELLTDGANFYSPAPIGTVLSFAGHVAPNGYLLCDGASYKRYDYPDLYAVIGNTYGGDDVNFNVPDYRETVLVGVGENTTDTIASHDVYELGEFKDDQLQGHWHILGNSNGAVTVALGASSRGGSVMGANPASETRYTVENALDAITDGTNGEPRKGTTTHGKQKGVTYIIKAKHTNEGTDTGVSDDVVNYVDNKYATKADLGSNVPMTEITFTNSTNWSNSSGNLKTFYMVRNGWCFLHVVAHCNKVASDDNSVVYAGLPIPPFQVYGKFVGEDNTYEPCNLTVATNGQMLLRGGTVGKDYSFTYSYPVV